MSNNVVRFLNSNHIHKVTPGAGFLDFLIKSKLIARDVLLICR